jgi:hypothetical protein
MRNATVFVCLLLLGFLLGMPSPALAFDVNRWFNGGIGEPIHEKITEEALRAYRVDGVDGGFTDDAIKDIVKYNTETDRNQNDSALHFDNENFSEGSQRLINLKKEIIDIAQKQSSRERIRSRLGGALHTVQDFYAHSNWVELQNQKNNGNPTINKELGRGKISNVADQNTPTCPTDNKTLSGEGLNQLTSGYFYSLAQACTLPPNVNRGKCFHGWEHELLGVAQTCGGINKDNSKRPGYTTAKDLAGQATKDYLDQILKEGDLAGNVKAAKFLMGIRK